MKKFKITVNGKSYEVEVEDLGGSGVVGTPAPKAASTPAPAPKSAPTPATPKATPAAPKTEAPKAVPQGAETVEAPMPGTIFDIKVREGDSVTEGQVLVILEAMKMENEIVAPRSGKVAAVNVTKGSSVNPGDPLVSLS